MVVFLSQTLPAWKIKLLYDGQCPLCVREVNFLKAQDRDRGLIAFVDISDRTYDPAKEGGVGYEAAMGRIHAVKADGTVIQNLEVFRQIYETLGLGWVYAATRLPGIGTIAEGLYGLWADWRLRLTGRPDLATLVQEHEQIRRQQTGQQSITCEAEAGCDRG